MTPILVTLRDQIAARVEAGDPLTLAELAQVRDVIAEAVTRYERAAAVLQFPARKVRK